MDDYDEEFIEDEELDDEDEDFDDFDNEDNLDSDDNNEIVTSRLMELEELGSMDGQQDGISGSFYTGYGASVEDLDNLSDEEKNAYEMGYYNGFDASGGKM